MKPFKQFVTESTTLSTGIGIRNHLVKHFDATPIKSYPGSSNPYADYKETRCHIPHDKVEEIKKHFESHGWTSHTKNLNDSAIKAGIFHMKHPTNDNVHMTIGGFNHKKSITIYSPKKAKRSNLPLYD